MSLQKQGYVVEDYLTNENIGYISIIGKNVHNRSIGKLLTEDDITIARFQAENDQAVKNDIAAYIENYIGEIRSINEIK